MKNNVRAIFLGICLATVPSLLPAQSTKTEENVIKNGSVVSVEYTVSGEDGKVIDSNKGKEPLKYTQGMQQMIPGFEKEVVGMKVGGEKHFKIKPEDGYGPVNPNAVQEVPKEKIPAEGLKVGTTLTARNAQGQMMQVRVREIKEKTVVLDLNHPLAGRTLVFDVKVLKIESQPVK
jgi:FKBP-type peptidyl-prolyl cis-trans isomerase SlyD